MGVRLYATALLSAAKKSGSPVTAVVMVPWIVVLLVKTFSTELLDVPPKWSRRVVIPDTAVSKVRAVAVVPVVRPVLVPANCSCRTATDDHQYFSHSLRKLVA